MQHSISWHVFVCLAMLFLAAHDVGAQPDVLRAPLRAMHKDPFASYLAAPIRPAAPEARPVSAPEVPPMAAPLPVQPVPELDLAFAGRLWQGDGQQVLAMHQGQLLVLQPGLALGNGYVVKTIQPEMVELVYEPLKQVRRWRLPVPPSFEVR
jgi:hypothetical protein